MADQFNIEAKLKITGVDVKGDLDAGTLKFKVDTSALKKLVSDAGEAAKKVKAKFDNIKLNKIKIVINKNSLRLVESQIRRAVENAVKKTKLQLQTTVAGGTKADPFKAQRQAASKSAQSLRAMHNLTKQVNQGLRSLVRTMGSLKQGPAAGAAAKGKLPFPTGARTVNAGELGGGGGGRRPPGPGVSPGGRGRGGVCAPARCDPQFGDMGAGGCYSDRVIDRLAEPRRHQGTGFDSGRAGRRCRGQDRRRHHVAERHVAEMDVIDHRSRRRIGRGQERPVLGVAPQGAGHVVAVYGRPGRPGGVRRCGLTRARLEDDTGGGRGRSRPFQIDPVGRGRARVLHRRLVNAL